jgi:uncharacterized protein YggE
MTTKRVLFVCAALLGTSGLAAAQPIPLHAPGTPATPAGYGITVSGRGTVHVRPDSLKFSAFVPGPQRNVSLPAFESGVAAIVAALRKDGIADAHTASPGNGMSIGGNGGAQMITGSLRAPTRMRAQSIYTDAAAAAAPFPVAVSNILINYAVDDCAPVEAKAAALAIDDARRRALAIATASNVRLGGVINVTELPNGENCTLRADTPPSYDLTPPATDADNDVFASLTVTTTVTFAIDRPAK